MPDYQVLWAIDVSGSDPRDAASNAEPYLLERGARVYEVREWKYDPIDRPVLGEPVEVDLDDEA